MHRGGNWQSFKINIEIKRKLVKSSEKKSRIYFSNSMKYLPKNRFKSQRGDGNNKIIVVHITKSSFVWY